MALKRIGMLRENDRICDVCGENIPNGRMFRAANIPPGAAALFLDIEDPGLIPTWDQNPDGTVRLDICQECTLSMGNSGFLTSPWRLH